MKDRIRLIMEDLHMNQQVFSDFVGISTASLSGIFKDRTRPTLNTVEAIKKKIPSINTDWLMFGRGPMYMSAEDGSDTGIPTAAHQPTEQTLNFDVPAMGTPAPQGSMGGAAPSVQMAASHNSVRNTRLELMREDAKNFDKPQRKVTEIRVYYDDQTWESFVPSKK